MPALMLLDDTDYEDPINITMLNNAVFKKIALFVLKSGDVRSYSGIFEESPLS